MLRISAALCLIVLTLAAGAWADDWPTLHHDVARSGASADSPAPPYRLKWARVFCDENIDTGAEVIVAGDCAYIGTYAGNVYAMNRADGATVWRAELGSMIHGSPAEADGVLYVATLDGLHALDAATGERRWFLPIEFGIRTSPCVVDGSIYIGSRAGELLAIDAADGAIGWRVPLDGPIYTSCAYADGVVYVADETGRGYAYDAQTGQRLWQSETMYAATLRYYYPLVWGDNVVFLTMPAMNRHGLREQAYNVIAHAILNTDQNWHSMQVQTLLRSGMPDPAELDAETQVILDWLNEEPGRQSVWAFDRETGEKAMTVPMLHTEGNAGIRCGAAVGADGWLYSISGSVYSCWRDVYPMCPTRVAPAGTNRLCNFESWSRRAPRVFGTTFEYNEAYTTTLAGTRLLFAHTDLVWGVDTADWEAFTVTGRRDYIANIYGHLSGRTALPVGDLMVTRCANEWHGTGRAGVSVADSELYWMAGGIVQCFVGDDEAVEQVAGDSLETVELPETGPYPNPEPIDVPDEAIDAMLTRALPREAAAPTTEAGLLARQRLNDHVAELVESWPLMPLLSIPGHTGGAYSFARPRETFASLAIALPQLDPANREAAIDLLLAELEANPPWSTDNYAMTGQARLPGNAHDIVEPGAPSDPKGPEPLAVHGLHAFWALCHYADRADLAEHHWSEVQRALTASAGQLQRLLSENPGQTIRDDYHRLRRQSWFGNKIPELNLAINGLIGYIRLANMTGRPDQTADARALLAELIDQRVNVPQRKLSVQLPFGGEPVLWYEMTPELASLVEAVRGPAIREYYTTQDHSPSARTIHKFIQNNFWHIAHGEGLMYGETANGWPDPQRGLYFVRAMVFEDGPAELLGLADMPWCAGDLFYIDKLALTLWAEPGRAWETVE